MRYFLCLVVVVVACDAARITRTAEHPYFPNFQSVYHGHGATSYQNVQINNHGSTPLVEHYEVPQHAEHLNVGSEYYGHHEEEPVIPIVEHPEQADHLTVPEKVLYEEIAVNHVDLKPDLLSHNHYYENYDHAQNYEYHLE